MKSSSIAKGVSQFIKEECGDKKAIIGISGGLDSAVVAGLATRALGSDNVTGVFMFDKDVKNVTDYEDAIKLWKKYNFGKIEIDMALLKNAFLSSIGHNKTKHRLLVGNAMARMRMTLLYTYAFWYDGLVLGTGDKSEWLMGFFTKHGDGGCDIAPILDLYKTEVRELANYLGIPPSIVNKPSSPNLWQGQTAEDELGFTYFNIDAMLKGEISMNKEVQKRFLAAEHKRRLPRYWRNSYAV